MPTTAEFPGREGRPPAPYRPTGRDANVAHWKINGFDAAIVIWTQEEWDRLEIRPRDAQYYPCGVWCALRLA